MSPTHAPNFTSPENLIFRQAVLSDQSFLHQLEIMSFSENRQCSCASLHHSITSPSQFVIIVESKEKGKKVTQIGAAVIFQYKRSLRLYSLAVDKKYQMSGVGEALMNYILDFALSHGYERISLEADAGNSRLINWYRKMGFEESQTLRDYYGPNETALKMIQSLTSTKKAMDRIVIVVDEPSVAKKYVPGITFVSAASYLSDTNYSNSKRFHVLNLCSSHKTHSLGYYVSLLAAARNHWITPSVMAVKDATTPEVAQSLLDEIKENILDKVPSSTAEIFELTCILGQTPSSQYNDLAKKLFSLFSIPFFSVTLEKNETLKIKKIKLLNVKQVAKSHPELLKKALNNYCDKKRCNRQRLKNFKYDLAILVNNSESTPPSCPLALEKFRKAAEKIGFYVEFITKADHRRICEFDALFIRETTAIDNHTYAMARYAYTEGLVVIDDPWSIMLCANKVFLQERLTNAGICQPRGWLLTKKLCTPSYLKTLPIPLVLKLPESSFSKGVFQVKSFEELQLKLPEMFAQTELVIAQEFLTSDYDWRIGLLDNTPLFACKYYMANNHWQIYNWQSGKPEESEEFSGKSETLSVKQVPPHILKAAVSASSLIGNGFYGVDIKEINGKAYVIEVNDNPSIDAGIEDELLGDELYERVMLSIYNRIETERSQVRYLY